MTVIPTTWSARLTRLSGRPPGSGSGRLDRLVLALTSVPLVAVIGVLLAVVWLSFITGIPYPGNHDLTFDNFTAVYESSATWTVLRTTLVFAGSATILALILGLAFSWIVERTDFRAKRLTSVVMLVTLLMPGFFPAMGWLFLLGPRIGILSKGINQLTGLSPDALNVSTPLGMGLVQGLLLTSLAFIMFGPSFRSTSSQLLEASEVHGLSTWTRFWRIEFPLMRPAVISTGIYVFMVAVSSFDIPAFLGLSSRVYTFTSYLYQVTSPQGGIPAYGQAAALTMMVLLTGCLLTLVYQRSISRTRAFQVLEARGYRTSYHQLGRRSWIAWVSLMAFLLLAIVLPLLVIVWVAFVPYFQLPSISAFHTLTLSNFDAIPWASVKIGLQNTLILMALVPIVVVAVSVVLGWFILRSKSRLRRWADVISFLPHSIPSVVFAVVLQSASLFLIAKVVDISGTVWIIAIAYVLVFLAFGVRSMTVAIIQLSTELEESAFVGGMSVLRVMIHVIVPLIRTAVRNAWLWVALLVFRELTIATVLLTTSNLTLPTVIWSTFYSGAIGAAAALSLTLMVLFIPLVLVYLRLTSGARQ